MQVDSWNEHSTKRKIPKIWSLWSANLSKGNFLSYRGPICGSGFQFRVHTSHISLGKGDAVGLIWARQIWPSKSLNKYLTKSRHTWWRKLKISSELQAFKQSFIPLSEGIWHLIDIGVKKMRHLHYKLRSHIFILKNLEQGRPLGNEINLKITRFIATLSED